MRTSPNLSLRLADHPSSLTVTVSPADGGRVLQTTVWGVALLHDAPDASLLMRGCYPMAPWAGRVRDGRFEFDGTTVTLTPNVGPHPLHGVAFDHPWTVTEHEPVSCRMRVDLDWPLGGEAVQEISLHDGPSGGVVVDFSLEVTAGDRGMPAVIGWHPCFRPASSLETSFEHMYRRDAEGVALDELTEVGPLPWDDCFPAGPTAPRLVVDGVTIALSSDCDHWVVYTGDPAATCVEPQSAPPDAFHGVGPGPAVLAPGETLRRTMSWLLTDV
ncbi:MAG: hypothetical protein RJB65_1582 [Actinomycetota bacterium]